MNLSHYTLAIKYISARKCKALLNIIKSGSLAQFLDSHTDTYIWLLFPSVEYRDQMLASLKEVVPNHRIILKNQKEVIEVR